MNKKVLILLLGLVLLLAVAGLAYNGLSSTVQMDNLAAGDTVEAPVPEGTGESVNNNLAPDFTVYDLEGNAHALSDFRGKPVIVNFWASWCGPCKSEMPDFEEKFLEYGEEIHFLMVNLTDGSQETVDSAYSFVAGQGYTFPVYYDTALSGAVAYAVSAVPATYFIDENGALVAYGKGAMDAATLQKGIDMLLK